MREGMSIEARNGLVWLTLYGPEAGPSGAIKLGLQVEQAVGLVEAIEEALETIRYVRGDDDDE